MGLLPVKSGLYTFDGVVLETSSDLSSRRTRPRSQRCSASSFKAHVALFDAGVRKLKTSATSVIPIRDIWAVSVLRDCQQIVNVELEGAGFVCVPAANASPSVSVHCHHRDVVGAAFVVVTAAKDSISTPLVCCLMRYGVNGTQKLQPCP
jgi:hypothetical protein